MLDILFIALYIFLIGFFFLSFTKLKVNNLSILSMLYLKMFLFYVPAFFLVYFEFFEVRNLVFYDSFSVKIAIIKSFLIFIYISVIVILLSYYYKLNSIKSIDKNDLVSKKSIMYFAILLIFSIIVLIYKIYSLPSIALFMVFLGEDSSLVRSDMRGGNFLVNFFSMDVLTFCSIYFFMLYKKIDSKLIKTIFYVSFLFVTLSLILNTQKAPMMFYLITLYFLNSYIKNKKIKISNFLNFSIPLLIVLILMYIFFMGRENVNGALEGITQRLFIEQFSGFLNYIWIFPDMNDYLYGKSFPNPSALLPFEHVNVAKLVREISAPQYTMRGIVGSEPTLFWGEMYANFSYLGILISPFLVVIVYRITLTAIGFIITDKCLYLSLIFWFGLYLSRFGNSGFSWVLWQPELVLFFILLFLHKVIKGKTNVY